LVTGGAGFIGSHLCEALLRQGNQVLCLDNFCDFYSPSVKRSNISSCLSHPSFQLVEADITQEEQLEQLFHENDIGLVIHLAAMAGVRPSIVNPELYARVNVQGTVNLLQQCANRGIGKFIFASSSSVYGNNPKVPFSESDPVDHPISPYAATKKAGELFCHTWHHLYGISMLCLRFFTVYGPRQRPDLAIHKFLSLMERGEALPVFGDGSTSRDYTFIDDIIQGVLKAVDYIQHHHCYEIINLGNDHSVSLSQMISTLEAVSGKTAIQKQQSLPEGDVLRTHADLSKAKRLLGYHPTTSFIEGVKTFWDWWKSVFRS